MAKIKWSEETIARMYREGRGQGTLSEYKAWTNIREFNSRGVCSELYTPLFKRKVQLFSTLEQHAFVIFERLRHLYDLNEQFPLSRELTQKIAEKIGIKYPCYPGTNVPVVYSVDFMILEQTSSGFRCRAFDVKSNDGLEDESEIRNLEMHRVTLEAMDIEHVLVAPDTYPEQYSANLYIIRNEHPEFIKPSEAEKFVTLRGKALKAVSALPGSMSILDAANRLDNHLQIPTGQSMRAFTQLIACRAMSLNLEEKPFREVLLGDIRV